MLTETAPKDRTANGPAELTPTWEIAHLFPLQGMWDEWDYMALRPNRQVEFTDGIVEVLPVPTQSHQRILRFLFQWFVTYVSAHRLGEVLFAPLRVKVRSGKYREPDMVLMLAENAGRQQDEFWLGADLVLEIVSEDAKSRARDLERKRRDYAEGQIPEYWIVDPVEERITVLVLAGDDYRVHGEFPRGAQATSVLLAGFSVDVAAALDAAKQ